MAPAACWRAKPGDGEPAFCFDVPRHFALRFPVMLLLESTMRRKKSPALYGSAGCHCRETKGASHARALEQESCENPIAPLRRNLAAWQQLGMV